MRARVLGSNERSRFDCFTLRWPCLTRRVLAALLCALLLQDLLSRTLVFAQSAAGPSTSEAGEFDFAESENTVPSAQAATGKNNALDLPAAPVTSSGTLT